MELDPLNQIQSISDFRSKTDKVLKTLSRRKTVLLTQHGKTRAVLVDPKTFEAQSDRLRLAEKIIRADRELHDGKGVDHDDVERLAKQWL